MTPMLIGIAGGTGSGKSTFADGLKKLFPNDITIISYDNYYKPQDHLTMEERVKNQLRLPRCAGYRPVSKASAPIADG